MQKHGKVKIENMTMTFDLDLIFLIRTLESSVIRLIVYELQKTYRQTNKVKVYNSFDSN